MRKLKTINKGERFGNLTVIKELPFREISSNKRLRHFKFKCDCGNYKNLDLISVTRSKEPTKSCGCLLAKSTKERFTKHGLYKHPLYKTYYGFINRCCNKENKNYSDYGGRGIKVCKEWRNKEDSKGLIAFIEWNDNLPVNKKWRKGLELDRKNNNEGYSPDNCRWVTKLQNKSNCRNNVFLYYQGKEYTLAEFCRKFLPNRDPSGVKKIDRQRINSKANIKQKMA